MDVSWLPKVHRTKTSTRHCFNSSPVKYAVSPFISKREIALTILSFEKVVQSINWFITLDLLGQLRRNIGLAVLQFDCVSEFESSQALNERGEDTVARDFFRVENKLNKASCQSATTISTMRRKHVESNDSNRHTGQKTRTSCAPTIAYLRRHFLRE